MFKKVLIANRGEIALRILRACRELDIRTVAVHSTVDRESLPVQMADESVCVGPGPSPQSYLNIPNIVSAALLTGAEAVHPGYGFLGENARFAEICTSHGLKFIGPPVQAMLLMGDKARARETARREGVPVLPGTGVLEDESQALAFARVEGFPLIIKAAAGGGGRGMRVVGDVQELLRALPTAQAEALSAFGDDRVYLEQYLPEPRHVEIQILADEHGHVVHLGERDCSVQRRKQKLVEESPSQALDPELRRLMGEAGIRVARAAGYTNAGTVEFLLDRETSRFYFMEMNTRIQVEHPVTEMVTGLDLVRCQLRVAAGEPLDITQEEVRHEGHAVECRINAENAEEGFAPCVGPITSLVLPGGPGIRVDTHITQGYVVSPFYDSLLAKVIAHGKDREEALTRMDRALSEFQVGGLATTVEFHRRILNNAFFRQGEVHTNFVERHLVAV